MVLKRNEIMQTIKSVKGLSSGIHDKMVEFLYLSDKQEYRMQEVLNYIESINDNKRDFHKFKELKDAIKNLYNNNKIGADKMKNEKMINMELKRGKNSIYGNPSFLVIDYDNQKAMDNLIKLGYFKKYKKVGLSTANNSSYAYEICNNCDIKLFEYTIHCTII